MDLLQPLADLLFPRRCLGCGQPETWLCERCLEELPPFAPPWCIRCGLPGHRPGSRHRCVPSALDGLRSLGPMKGVLRGATSRLKFYGQRALAPRLAELLAAQLRAQDWPVALILAVPLHAERLRQRGYNQADLLARQLGRLAGVPVGDALERQRATQPQIGLPVAARRENVAGAFRVRVPCHGQRILLVDDVATTGATLGVCAGVLKAAGAERVWAITVARET